MPINYLKKLLIVAPACLVILGAASSPFRSATHAWALNLSGSEITAIAAACSAFAAEAHVKCDEAAITGYKATISDSESKYYISFYRRGPVTQVPAKGYYYKVDKGAFSAIRYFPQ